MIKNSLYKNGTVICVWVKADTKQEALENYWSFWNHGATSAENLHWIDEAEGYFWSDEKRLKRYFKNSSRAIVLNELGEAWEGDSTSGPQVANSISTLARVRFERLWNTQGPSPFGKARLKNYGDEAYEVLEHGSSTGYGSCSTSWNHCLTRL